MNQQKELEHEMNYMKVLSYVEAKDLVSKHGYTAGKIRGALTRYCRNENVERPQTFTELEDFTPDFVDWWLDSNPEDHEGISESRTKDAVNLYLAYANVWKAKLKNNDIISSNIQIMASSAITVRNALATATKAALSYNKRVPKTSQSDLMEVFPKAFKFVMPAIFQLQAGEFKGLSPKEIDEIGSLVGGYFAKDKTVLAAVNSIKMLEAPVMAKAA